MSEDLMKLLAEQIALQKQQLEQQAELQAKQLEQQAAQHKEDIEMQREQTEKTMLLQREQHKEEMEKQQEQIAGLLQMVHGQAKDGNSSQVASTVKTSIPPLACPWTFGL